MCFALGILFEVTMAKPISRLDLQIDVEVDAVHRLYASLDGLIAACAASCMYFSGKSPFALPASYSAHHLPWVSVHGEFAEL